MTTLTTTVIRSDSSDIEVTFTVNPTVFPMFFVTESTDTLTDSDMEQFYENAFECLYDTEDESLLALSVICGQTERAHYAA